MISIADHVRFDFHIVKYLPENDRVRDAIHPEVRRQVLKRLLALSARSRPPKPFTPKEGLLPTPTPHDASPEPPQITLYIAGGRSEYSHTRIAQPPPPR